MFESREVDPTDGPGLAARKRHPAVQRSQWFIGLIVTACASQAALAENVSLANANGPPLSALADFPSGEGPFPALVLAPGQGYHMALPAMETTARSIAGQGVAVIRFDWTYFTAEPKGQPSDDLSKELQDLQAVLAWARKHPKVRADNLSVGGKSLGSLVAWRAFAADSRLRGALLLTPVCSEIPENGNVPQSEVMENYPGFQRERRPTLWISGDKDPFCASSILYGLAGASAGTARVAIVGGDHSYENEALPPAPAEATRKRNLAAVSTLAAGFVAELASTPP